MTTLVGIATEMKGRKKGVVLASDLRGTRINWSPVGDVAYRRQEAVEVQKIHIDDSGRYAFCMTGPVDDPWVKFCSDLRRGKVNVKKAIKKGFFQEFKNLNEYRWDGKVPTDDLNSLLIASRAKGAFGLYTCFPLGRVESRTWTAIGSGSNYALASIREHAENIPDYTSPEKGIDLAAKSLEAASQDIYTGGLDIALITPDKIHSFGDIVKDELGKARDNALTRMKEALIPQTKK